MSEVLPFEPQGNFQEILEAVQETRPEPKPARKSSEPFRRSVNQNSFEPGMLRLQLNIGRQQGIKPG